MPYDNVANLVTVTKTNMINKMLCSCGTLRTTAVRIWHQVFRRACAEVSAAPKFDCLNSQCCSILNAPPILQVLSGAPENALAETKSTVQSARVAGEHLTLLSRTADGYRSV
jgi:hypothetical protein